MIFPKSISRLFKTGAIAIVLAGFFFSPLGGPLVPEVHAQRAGAGGVSDSPDLVPCGGIYSPILCTDYGQAQATIAKLKSRIDFQLTYAAYLGVLNMATLASQQVAYDTAEWVASGFKGSSPLFEVLTFGDYTKQITADAVGEFMGTFSEEFTQGAFGIDLCRPPRLEGIALEFALTLPELTLNGLNRPRPKCAWTDIVDNWEATASSLDNATSLQAIRGTFSTGGNDVAFGIGLNTAVFDAIAEKREAGILDRLEGGGFKSVQNFISGNIETPASVVNRSIEQQIIEQPNNSQNIQTSALLSNAFDLGWVQLGTVAASTFTNVLVTRLFGKIAKGLFKSTGVGYSVPDLTNPFAATSNSAQNREIIAAQYGDILTPNIQTTEQQDLLAELVGCPDTGRTKWNCSMSASFETALRQGGGMTLRQAIEQGFINEDFELIPSTQPQDNLDPFCSQRAFCVSNLRKLRLARIIPIGWELAADSGPNQQRCAGGSGCVTLGEVMRGFDDCNEDGALDDDHPWCHLIDPNWVLTSFPAQCVTKGYGNSFIAGTNERVQECQDTVTCLERDANGKCSGGYGYCLAEQTFWQFDSLSCDEEYVSCRSFTPRGTSAKSVGYLRSTIDYGSCNETNVGCMWYASRRSTPADGQDVSSAWDASYALNVNKFYFDKTLARCDAQYDGCSDVRRVVQGESSVNLIRNSSFEETNESGSLAYWLVDDTGALDDDENPFAYTIPDPASGSASFDGSRSYEVKTPPSSRQVIRLEPGRQYTMSFYARSYAGAIAGAGASMQFYRPMFDPEIPPPKDADSMAYVIQDTDFFVGAGCHIAGPGSPGGMRAYQANILLPNTLDQNWQRFECSFVTPPETKWGRLYLYHGSGGSWLIDAVQLEESQVATPYIDGLNPLLEPAYLKVPPEELACTGNVDTDPEICSDFAPVCKASEAGCQGYRAVLDAGDVEIPAVLSLSDYCPEQCVGYSEFRKQASMFDLVRNEEIEALNDPDDDTIASFIPSTATSCSVQDVGCERFTNLDTEGVEAYSYIRQCEKPNDDTQTYYTWEGSEASGYQLVTWSLQRDTNAPLPQGPRYLASIGLDGLYKDPETCNALSYLSGFDPDCRQFYDPQGNPFYRFESQTILADEDCQSYRKADSTVADCEKTGGNYNANTGQCIYQLLAAESRSCGINVAGCRAYAGTRGGAQNTVYSEDFLSGGYLFTPGANVSEISLSEESVLVGDTSLRIVPQDSNALSFVYVDIPAQEGGIYELSFWGKLGAGSASNLTVFSVNPSDLGDRSYTQEVSLRTVWNQYRIGPFEGITDADGNMRIMLSGFTGSAASFIDTVRIRQVTDTTYVVKDSWETPGICDRTTEGIYQPRAMLGCRDYTDRNGNLLHVRQFTRLCREEAIGCTAFVNTQNSESPYEERWEYESGAPYNELIVRRPDSFVYLIDNGSGSCPATEVSCRAYGLPRYSQDRLSLDAETPFETVYLKDDVTQYGEAICHEEELFCESFTYTASGQTGTEYFRAPADHSCEYKEGVIVARRDADGNVVPDSAGCDLPDPENYLGTTYDGWFRVGTSCPCDPDLLQSGNAFGIRYTGDPGYNGWVGSSAQQTVAAYGPGETYEGWTGICPEAQAECTELRDVNDTSDPLHPLGRAYFVINDERLDKESCNGLVDPGRGCVLFRDMSDTRLLYNNLASFVEYRDRGYQAVQPIDCNNQPDHPSCLAAQDAYIDQIATAAGEQEYNRVYAQTYAATGNSAQSATAAASARSGLITFIRNNPPALENDTNLVIKVSPDRSCSQWLACRTGETVYDAQTGQYKSICSELDLCNASGDTEGEGVPFCTNYVDRSSDADTILTQYRVIDAATYSDRQIGFGATDYSGFTLPDQFQVMDTTLAPIASMLSPDPAVANQFKKDYRLGIRIPMDSAYVRVPTPQEAVAIGAQSATLRDAACFYPQSGSFGLRTTATGDLSATGEYCWLSMDQGQPPQIGIQGAALVSDNLNALNLIQRFAQTSQPDLDQVLSRSFPDTQCKAAPEADAPFGNEFVVEWDDSVTPPEPQRVTAGYGTATFCEYGEECACVYKRVNYGSYSKFYEPLSTDVVNAVCIGGSRDGLACIPDSGIEGSQQVNVTISQPAEGEEGGDTSVQLGAGASGIDSDRRCGEGGVCTPISDVELVRGITGQCLQYDISRPVAGDQTRNECLVWNPNPVMSGPGDQYHWTPTAGYQPPQSSGRYYCTGPVREPRVQQFNAEATWPKDIPDEGFDWAGFAASALTGMILDPVSMGAYEAYNRLTDAGTTGSCGDGDYRCKQGFGPWPNSEGTYAGRIRAFFYADWFTSDGSCVNFLFWGGCTGNEGGASLDGHKADGTKMGDRCEQIDDEDQAFVKNENLMRLVTTGQGKNRSYTEYAVLFNPWHVAYGSLGFAPQDWEVALDYSLEDAIANFEFSVPKNKIGCGYSEEWAEVHVNDYDAEKSEWRGTDQQWQATFNRYLAEGGGTLNRTTSQIVTEDGTPTGIPVRVECAIQGSFDDDDAVPDNRGGEEGLCYIKTWELNYRAEGQLKFQAFGPDIGRNSLDHLSRRPVYGKCDSSRHWFSIRAVFEDINPEENNLDPEDITPDRLVGPFQFVGLWITACAPGDQTKYIYMDMKMNSADICREMAETISKDSHESVVFTDRNSSRSGYSMQNGFNWNTTNIPFGASLATGDAGEQPLFMTGVRQRDVNPLNPPTFTYPGQTYFSSSAYPTSNWGMLSNIFARIYRIYGYYSRAVTRDDWACTNTNSPNFAQWCPPLDAVDDANRRDEIAQQFCGFEGTCLRGGIEPQELFSQKVCNSFSGVNRGLDCSSDPDICHVAPMREVNGALVPQLGACVLFQGLTGDGTIQGVDVQWTQLSTGRYRCTGDDCGSDCTGDTGCTRAVAAQNGAFRCQGSVRDPELVREEISGNPTYASYCTRESEESTECPSIIPSGDCQNINADTGIGSCGGSPWAECREDDDCHFFARNYWPSGSVNDTFYWTRSGRENSGLGQHNDRLNQSDSSGDDNYIAQGEGFRYDVGWIVTEETVGNATVDVMERTDTWFTYLDDEDVQVNAETYREAFWPATPFGLDMGGGIFVDSCDDEDGACFYATRVNSTGLTATNVLTYDSWDDSDLLQLYPGFNPFIYWNSSSGNNTSDNINSIYAGAEPLDWERVTEDTSTPVASDVTPYIQAFPSGNYDDQQQYLWAHYAACESAPLMFREIGDDEEATRPIVGTCRGGGVDGQVCSDDTDCRPPDYSQSLQNQSVNWCNPVTTGYDESLTQSYLYPTDGSANACWPTSGRVADSQINPNHPQFESDPSLDNNICTHPAGYWPRPQLCPDPNDEYCGLFGYNLRSGSIDSSVSDERPLPTDVTAGLYTPIYLNAGGSNVSDTARDYNYVDYYNPEPPHTAAPDIRTCQGSTCRVTALDTFSVNGLAAGIVNGGVGSHVATIRFYAWAAHEQMPLKRLVIDWGDGTQTELPDAYLKNRKPYCQTPKECSETPGLTCQTDADCPPGGGLCVTMGNCSNRPDVSCYADNQCHFGFDEGFCEPRTYFGNDAEACDEQYFEFKHAYSCDTYNLPDACTLSYGRCSGDLSRTCAPALPCANGDECLQGYSADAEGCYESSVSSCRFTPRILLVDNWGWCTGECRSLINPSNGELIDADGSWIRHPNGGCYDGSLLRSNVTQSLIGSNECSLTVSGSSVRPWIVFPGVVQLRPGEEL